jgi:ABC-type multidrug transport system fused ATPase/permease subunit
MTILPLGFVSRFLSQNWYGIYILTIYLSWLQGYFLATSRELTRLDSITKAPVIHHFSESISGVMTIRSFRKQDSFCQENVNRVNANLRMDFHNNGSNEWLGLRLEMIGSFILCASAMFLILLPSSIVKPGNCTFTCYCHEATSLKDLINKRNDIIYVHLYIRFLDQVIQSVLGKRVSFFLQCKGICILCFFGSI